VGAVVDLERVGEAVALERVVEFNGVYAEAVLVAYVNGNVVVAAQVADVLVDEVER
jgi:hypothetical protein